MSVILILFGIILLALGEIALKIVALIGITVGLTVGCWRLSGRAWRIGPWRIGPWR